MSEAHVPTQHPPSGEEPRVPSSHVDARRPGDPRRQASQGSHAPQRLTRTIGRLRGRTNIELARRARRSSAGAFWVRWAPVGAEGPGFPEVGFAVGRAVGTAVVRNRLRRRLRAAMAELAPGLAPGRYLVGAAADAVSLPYLELVDGLRASLVAAGALDGGPAS